MPGTFMFAERTALERKGEMDEEYEVNHGEEEKKKGGGGKRWYKGNATKRDCTRKSQSCVYGINVKISNRL